MKLFVMMNRLFVCVLLGGVCCFESLAQSWIEISPEDLASTECPSDPSASAEILYKRTLVDQSNREVRFRQNYLRVKVYDEGAVDRVSRVNITHANYLTVSSIYARVVKPDGSIHELDRSEVQKEKLVKKGDLNLQKTSFTIPNLEPGDIVEYQYKMILDEGYYSRGLFVSFQEEWPIRRVEVAAKPFVSGMKGLKWVTSRCDAKDLKRGSDGFYRMEMTNLPAHPEESNQPPERDSIAWLQFFLVESLQSNEVYWKAQARKLMRETTELTKPTSTVSAVVKKLLEGVEGEKERLRVLYDYCRDEIANVHERKKTTRSTPATKTLDRGYGSVHNVMTLFCAMARAGGYDARIAAIGDRSKGAFSRSFESIELIMKGRLAAVKLGDTWRLFDPGGKFYDFGELDWIHQGTTALIASKKEAVFHVTKVASTGATRTKQKADFELMADGSLVGAVSATFSGHENARLKRRLIKIGEEEQREFIERLIIDNLSDAEVREIVIENVESISQPLAIQFDVTIPRYAESVGDRLFFQPSVFRKNATPAFSESHRVTDMFFPFRISELDEISIKLPEGYELENPSAPKSFDFAKVIKYDVALKMNRKKHTLMYSRSVDFSGLFFPAKYYKEIKRLLDDKHRQDQHAITLKKSESSLSVNNEESKPNA